MNKQKVSVYILYKVLRAEIIPLYIFKREVYKCEQMWTSILEAENISTRYLNSKKYLYPLYIIFKREVYKCEHSSPSLANGLI